MAKCPFLKDECLKEGCELWLKDIKIVLDNYGTGETKEFSPGCSLKALGISSVFSLKSSQ